MAGDGVSLREAINHSTSDIVFDESLSGGTIILAGTQLDIDRDLRMIRPRRRSHHQCRSDSRVMTINVRTIHRDSSVISPSRAANSAGADGMVAA